MRVRRLTVRNDTFRSAKRRDSAPRRYVVSGTDSPLPFGGRGQGEGFAGCAANVGEPLTSILSPSAKGEAENAAMTPSVLYGRTGGEMCRVFWSAAIPRLRDRFEKFTTANPSFGGRGHVRALQKAAAFSLVEIVLALGVAGFCLVAVVGLMPVGVQTNRNATSQTAATNIMAAIVADLRTTPAAATTSPQFAITFDTEKTLFFGASGQASTSLGPDSRYRLNVTWNSAPTGLHYAVLKVSWPASVDPATATPSGVVKIFVAFDRN